MGIFQFASCNICKKLPEGISQYSINIPWIFHHINCISIKPAFIDAFPHIFVWGSCFWSCTPAIVPRHSRRSFLTHNSLTHNLSTHNLLTPNHTTCSHTACSHNLSTHNLNTTCSQTTYSHTTCSHTTCSGTRLALVARLVPVWRRGRRGCWRGRRGTWRYRLSLCMAGVAHRGTHGTGLALVARLVPVWRRGRCGCWRERRGTWWHRPSLCVAGVAWHLVTISFIWRGKLGAGLIAWGCLWLCLQCSLELFLQNLQVLKCEGMHLPMLFLAHEQHMPMLHWSCRVRQQMSRNHYFLSTFSVFSREPAEVVNHQNTVRHWDECGISFLARKCHVAGTWFDAVTIWRCFWLLSSTCPCFIEGTGYSRRFQGTNAAMQCFQSWTSRSRQSEQDQTCTNISRIYNI